MLRQYGKSKMRFRLASGTWTCRNVPGRLALVEKLYGREAVILLDSLLGKQGFCSHKSAKCLLGPCPKPCESGQGAGAARLILKRYNPFHGHFLDGLTRKKEKSAAGPEDIASRTAALMVYGFVILFRQRRDRLLK